MSEFKFIRGKYTNEKIFNSDYKDCLFACDKNGDDVSLNAVNNEEFQEKIVGLSPDRLSEIYTIRPSQIVVSAEASSKYQYSFTFEVNDNFIDIPNKVKESANKKLKDNTQASFPNEYPALNLPGAASKSPTSVSFNFKNGDKIFTKNLIFNVTGTLREKGYVEANGSVDTAYPTVNNIIDQSGTIENEVFKNGTLQSIVKPIIKTIKSNTVTVSKSGPLKVGAYYEPAEGFAFSRSKTGSNFIESGSTINYEKGLTFYLYKKEYNGDNKIPVYVSAGTCAVVDSNDIIKDYKDSYSGLYTIENGLLMPVDENDLLGKQSIIVYSNGSYYVSGNNAYENSTDKTKYVMLTGSWTNDEIKSSNTSVKDGKLSPKITERVFRQIISFNVNTTQSD